MKEAMWGIGGEESLCCKWVSAVGAILQRHVDVIRVIFRALGKKWQGLLHGQLKSTISAGVRQWRVL